LAVIVFSVWKNISTFTQKSEKKVCVKLSCIVEKEVAAKKKIQPKHKNKPKPTIKTPKPKPKKTVKKTPIVVPAKKEVEVKQDVEEFKEKPVIQPQEIEKVIAYEEPKEDLKEDMVLKQGQTEQDYIDENIAKITQLLQDNLYYPRSARRRGIVGKVVVRFKLSLDGKSYDIEVVSSSSNILSRAAIKTIQNLSGEFPKPKEKLSISVPIDYKLN